LWDQKTESIARNTKQSSALLLVERRPPPKRNEARAHFPPLQAVEIRQILRAAVHHCTREFLQAHSFVCHPSVQQQRKKKNERELDEKKVFLGV
jgi:hypothetical protein